MAVGCTLEGRVLRIESAEVLGGFEGFEGFLESGGPWVCGMDFSFGQPRPFVEALDRPSNWEGYVGKVSRLSKEEFEGAIKGQMAGRPKGDKYHYRLADRHPGSSSAMRLFREPVGKIFYRGAPCLLSSSVSVEPAVQGGASARRWRRTRWWSPGVSWAKGATRATGAKSRCPSRG